MDIKEFIIERKNKNHLNFDIEECLNAIKSYGDIYPESTEIKRFFHYILNKVGGIVNNIDNGYAELLGNLKVRGKTDITFYEFDCEEDYLDWQVVRLDIYEKLKDKNDSRLLNFLELTTMNMISDIYTNSKYELLNGDKTILFNKLGYGTDVGKASFIKYLGSMFKEGYSFKPIR